ncbi:MAG: hypothetical protein IIA27_10810 [Gemmatimonadetes bacterium]|nr:hypothetical protein [Gemmatimonadota bacterium]
MLATVISISSGSPGSPGSPGSSGSYAVADCGLKALGMDHGNPQIGGAKLWFCSDEHTTFAPSHPVRVGDRIQLVPAHVDHDGPLVTPLADVPSHYNLPISSPRY